jgi:hypothetical protein
MRAQTRCGDPAARETSGLVAYLDGAPVGWCAVAPRTGVPAADAVADDGALGGTGRGQGRRERLGGDLLRHPGGVPAPRRQPRARGGGRRLRAVEGCACRRRVSDDHRAGAGRAWGELSVGTLGIFEAAGFREVSRPVPRRVVMRIDFAGTAAT